MEEVVEGVAGLVSLGAGGEAFDEGFEVLVDLTRIDDAGLRVGGGAVVAGGQFDEEIAGVGDGGEGWEGVIFDAAVEDVFATT